MKFSLAAPLLAAAVMAACSAEPSTPESSSKSLLEILKDERIDRHIGIKPASATPDGAFTVYKFDPSSPARCVEGTPFYVSVRKGTSKNVMLYLQGGGACWDYDSCYVNSMAQTESSPLGDSRSKSGVFRADNPANPMADWNVVYASYCDASVWSGDADIAYMPTEKDQLARYPKGRTTYHHGLANLSAAVTIVKDQFKDAPKIVVTGSSAGGYGTLMGFMVVRSQFPTTPLYVINDAGPWLMNPDNHAMTDHALKNWGVEHFYPPGCAKCREQMYYIADWAMARDPLSRWALFSYDEDFTVGTLYLQYGGRYTDILFSETDYLHAQHAAQFNGYFLHGPVHTILWSAAYDTAEKDGVKLTTWISDMVTDSQDWKDLRH